MFEPDYTAQQSQAGPSRPTNRPTKEVVPTSDDEDIFFVSQSSDRLGSSLDSAKSSRRSRKDVEEDEDDDDQEPVLPFRHSPAPRRQSPRRQSPAVESSKGTAQIMEAALDASQNSRPLEVNTEPTIEASGSTMDGTISTPTVDRWLPPTKPRSAERTPAPSPLEPPDLPAIVNSKQSLNTIDNDELQRSVDLDVSGRDTRHILDEQAMLMEADDNVTLGRQDGRLSSSQQSDATLPFVESSLVSPQQSPPSSPALFVGDDPMVGNNPRRSEEQSASLLEDQEILRSPSLMDNRNNHDFAPVIVAMDPATDAVDGVRRPHLTLSPSSTPPLSPLRIPHRGASPPRPPDLPQQQPQTERPSDNHAVLGDEQLARAAAAQPPTPPRRQLRTRKAAQLNPYTLEAQRYQRALIRNDWQDAVVSQREWHRQERRRLAEEAARAQRDHAAAQGSEESQSQWLVPSSGPSSQADHEDLSLPSSPATRTMPEVFVEIPILGATDSTRRNAGDSRSGPSSPTPSQSGRLPDLAEMFASRNASLNRNRDRPGPSRPATYKGPRTTAQTDANGQTAPPQVSEDSQVNEEDSVPLPPLTRRRPPPRALSASESTATPASDRQTPAVRDAFIVESSEDERPAPAAPIAKPKRRSRWSGDGSSSDSTDYERRFRQLKKMMPAGMARKHIRDLRAMRHGKSYHSDGHLSTSSSDAGRHSRADQRAAARPPAPSVNAAGSSEDEELQPGQTRKRLRRHDSLEGNNALLLDPDSDSSSSSASSLSSGASVSFAYANLAEDDADANGHMRSKQAEEIDERPNQWWSVNRLDSDVPYRERDAIDRMLSRTEGRKTSSHAGGRRAKGTSYQRQARLDGFVSAHRQKERATHSTRSHLQEIDQNQRRQQRSANEKLDNDGRPRVSSRKKKKRKLDPRVGRTTTSGGRGVSGPLLNPPVARPRARPRLDLEQHELLFTANPAPRRYTGTDANINDASGDDAPSDDDGQWQILSHVIRDSTPVTMLDSRLAAPRARPGIAAQPGLSLSMANDAAPSPVRDVRESPSASVSSAGLARLHAMNGHSPGTPTRARSDAFPPKAPLRTVAGSNSTLHPGPVAASIGSDAWDDFEGISLDFGMAPFTEAIPLNVGDSSLLARLPDLIALPDRLLRREHVPRTWAGQVLRLEDTVLDLDMDHDELATTLPFYVDNLRLTISRALGGPSDDSSVDGRRHARNLVADTNAFLGCWLVRQAQGAGDRQNDAASMFRSYRILLERIEQLQASVLSLGETPSSSKATREDRKSICLQLAWMRFELCWRAMAICDADANYALEPEAPTVESLLSYSRTLMSLLLHHGLHRCVRNVRKAAMASNAADAEAAMDEEQDETAHVSIEEATAMWLSVIHLLDSFEKSRGVMDGRLFWTQFETAYQRWDESMPKRAPLLRSESLWYCLFALELMSQISPAAQTQASPLLRECWPLVTRALSLVHFRSDESKELANGWHMLAKRDAYVRVVLQRCCLLTSEWRWTMEGAEVTLARLFDIFNSHKLADLPTEKQHDFPAFLRDFDVDKLSTADVAEGEAMQDPGFHLFIRLLGRMGQKLRASAADAKDGDRRISRLFSRMTPVRVMPFTRTDVPTSSQRSVLFNHYNVVMLFLYLVPASSPQRLRQIQSFLPAFKDADFVSQVTCIRAMMYVATIFRHHCLDLSPVTKWFGETIAVLRREYEELDSTTKQYERRQMQESLQARGGQSAARPDALRMAAIFENAPARQAALRRKEEVARLLVVALRSIQHIIRHGDLDGGRARPEGSEQRLLHHSLLSPAWTQQVLEAQISLEPRIGQEVLKCIQTFLLARIKILQPTPSTTTAANGIGTGHQDVPSAAASKQPQQPGNEESQDSFADLFEADDDFDFEDPLLARLLDEGDTSMEGDARSSNRLQDASKAAAAANEKRNWDREFADLVKSSISPSLFQLLSNIYHPDRRMEALATGSVVMSLGVTERLDEMSPGDTADRNSAAATSRTKMDRLLKAAEARQFLELVVDCWAGCAQVLVTNGLREWSSYLGFGNESWKRIDDPIGRRDVGLRFLQNVLSLDPTAVRKREYEVEFLAVWIQTAVARVLSVQDVYTKSLIEAAMESKNQISLLHALATQWRRVISDGTSSPSMAADDVGNTNCILSLDLDAFATHRPALLAATYSTLATSLSNKTTTMGTAYSILSALLSSLRAYIEDTPVANSKGPSLDYLRFGRTTLSDLESKLGSASVMTSLNGEYSAAVQLVTARLAVVERGMKGVVQE